MRNKSIRKNKTNRKKTNLKKTYRKEKYHKKTNRKRTNHKKTKHRKTYLKKRNIQWGGDKMTPAEFKEFYQELIQKGLSNYKGELVASFTTLKQRVFSNSDKSVEQKVKAYEKLIQNLIGVLNDENYRTIIIFILQLVIEIFGEFEAEGKEEILVEPLKRFFDSKQFQALEISEKKGTKLYRDITEYDYQGTDEVRDKHLESYMNDIVKGATMEFQNYDDNETKIKFYEQTLAKIYEDNLKIKKDLFQRMDYLNIGLFEGYSSDEMVREEEMERAAEDLELKDALELFHTASQEFMDQLKGAMEETVVATRGKAREEVGNTIYVKMDSLIKSLGITREEIDVVDVDESEDYWIEMMENILKIIEEKIKGMQAENDRLQAENENAITEVEEAGHRVRELEKFQAKFKNLESDLRGKILDANQRAEDERLGLKAEKDKNEERLRDILQSVNKLGSVTEGYSYSSVTNTEYIESTLEDMADVIEGKINQQIRLGTAEATQSLMEAQKEQATLDDRISELKKEVEEARATREKAKQEKESAMKSLKSEGEKNEALREINETYAVKNRVYSENNTKLKEQNKKLSIYLAKKEDCIKKTRQALEDDDLE